MSLALKKSCWVGLLVDLRISLCFWFVLENEASVNFEGLHRTKVLPFLGVVYFFKAVSFLCFRVISIN